ncbi:endolytic transglycosylase MltG [Thermaurantiacus sp.]
MRQLLVAALVGLVAAGLVLFLDLRQRWAGEAPAGAQMIEVEIPRGASLAAAASRLEAAGVIDSASRFRLAARLLGGKQPIRFGTYAFRAGEGYGRVLSKLQKGEVLTLFLTIPEGLPSVLVHERLMAAPRLTGTIDVPAEGSVLPATWDYRPGETRAALLARMQKGMADTLAELWATRKPTAAVRTPEEAVILASIVEKETGVPEERRRVAGLYSNRLRAGMKLEADPTVIYPVTQGRPLGRRIRASELKADTGFNTYARPGLPKGPIANPGRESLAAVLDPELHAYLFMVADGSGGHAFARTYAEHRVNVERWYALRRERGEM